MTVHHYRAVKPATFSYTVDILAENECRVKLGWGSLDDNFMVIRWELGISAVHNQAKKKS